MINEDAEQARVVVAILVSTCFLAMHLAIKPLKRCAVLTLCASYQADATKRSCAITAAHSKRADPRTAH